jgi:hypothetical protein
MPADAIPPRRGRAAEEPVSAFRSDDGSLMLAAYDGWQADSYWLTFSCAGDRGCHRVVHIGVRPAIARFGSSATVRGIARRLRCSACGGRQIVPHLSADTRGAFVREQQGPAPETRADLSAPTQPLQVILREQRGTA